MQNLDVPSKTSILEKPVGIAAEFEGKYSDTTANSFVSLGKHPLFIGEEWSSISYDSDLAATTEVPFRYRTRREVTPQMEEVLHGIVDRLEGDFGYILLDDSAGSRQLRMHIAVLTRDGADYEGAPVRIVTQIIDGEVITRVEHDGKAPANWLEVWDREWEKEHGEPYRPKRYQDYEKLSPIDPGQM